MTNTNQYTKRETSGLHTPAVAEIKSLAEYIELLSSGDFTNYLFRGEPTNYAETLSSGLRNITHPGHRPEQGVKNGNTFLKMQKDFKREVWHKLTPDERTHFSAFSQHHGIPTNLIDITTSPLVSLYFACQNYTNSIDTNGIKLDEERGFVYLFKDQFIDITNVLIKFEDANILEIFASNENDIFIDVYNLFLKFSADHPEVYYEYFKKLYVDFDKCCKIFDISIPKMYLNKFPDYDEGLYETKFFDYFMKLVELPIFNRYHKNIQNYSYSVFIYTVYLQILLKHIHFLPGSKSAWLNILPNFKYAPILTFERGRSQQGLFVYQNYLQNSEFLKDPYIESIQRVVPDKIVVITNKKEILKELDFMGINEKFIYGDYDHIASYIRNKHQ
ncbi:FRG domain-containing protein [Bacillus thuringiensis]|uniref:FRG domain-containing protein n=1 Tax=Bacillus thuringiensis subsp. jegathesan TaxID=56955 RepID=A0A9X6QXQ6_BACTJ|nr:FRG domain-containing protein [Bacillus thuringiensis]OUB63533.1 FRG domain-containing protein [Bacillus thuringiensis serovar jegathesan]